MPTSFDTIVWSGIIGATLLAFFAFIGFEDMVNVAEEVREPERTMPRAIFITLGLATLLYFLVTTIAVLNVPIAELGGSAAPLGLVFGAVTSLPPALIAAIATIATVNGIIIQVIMASRVLFGLCDQGTIRGAVGRFLGPGEQPNRHAGCRHIGHRHRRGRAGRILPNRTTGGCDVSNYSGDFHRGQSGADRAEIA